MSLGVSGAAMPAMMGFLRAPGLVVAQRLGKIVGILPGELGVVGGRAVAVHAVTCLADFLGLRLAGCEVGGTLRARRAAPAAATAIRVARRLICRRPGKAARVIGGEVGHVLVGERRGDAAHRRVAALAARVFLQRRDDVCRVLAGELRHLVDLGKGGAPARNPVAALAHLASSRGPSRDRRQVLAPRSARTRARTARAPRRRAWSASGKSGHRHPGGRAHR